MAISLGRDATITWGGVAVPGVRDVTVDYSVSLLEIRPFGSRTQIQYPTAYGVSITVETIDSDAADTAVAAAISGTEIAVVAGGHSFTGIVSRVSDAQPLDSVRAWAITLEKTQSGLRS